MAQENVDNLSLDEIVFENRNKAYGAYDLRRLYPMILGKAFLIGTILFSLLILTPFIVMKIKQMNAEEETNVKANMTEIIEEEPIIEEKKEEEVKPKEPEPPKEEPKVEIIKNVVPEPKKEPKFEEPPPKISEQVKTNTGVIAQEGEVKKQPFTPPKEENENKGTSKEQVEEKPKVDPNKVYQEVEQKAEFPGGIDAFRNRVMSDFDQGVVDEAGVYTTEVSFVVEKDGTITDVQTKGGDKAFAAEAARTVRSIKNKWKPAKINGENVRYRYKLPLKFNLEG